MKTETMVSMTMSEYKALLKKNDDLEIKIMQLSQDTPTMTITEYFTESLYTQKRYDNVRKVSDVVAKLVQDNTKLQEGLNKALSEVRDLQIQKNHERIHNEYLKQELVDYKSTFFYKLHNKLYTRRNTTRRSQ